MSGPVVSVLLPVRNMERFIAESLRSVLSQTLTDLEVVVVGDGCTDGSLRIVEGLGDPRVRILALPRVSGARIDRALNAALAVARGTYVARQDADDISLPRRFEKQVAALDADPGCAAAGTAAELIDAGGRPLQVLRVPTSDRCIRRAIAARTPFFHGSVMLRRAALHSAGGYRSFYRCEDVDLWLRLQERFRLINLPDVLYRYRIHGHTLSRLGFHRAHRARRIAWELALQRRSGQSEDRALAGAALRAEGRRVAREAERDYRAQLGNLLLRDDRRLTALREYARAIACRPLRGRSYLAAAGALLGAGAAGRLRRALAPSAR